MSKITVHDKSFKTYISHEELQEKFDAVAERVNNDFNGREGIPVVLCVLNGAMMFTAEMMQRFTFDCELASVKVKSYEGTQSTGNVKVVNPVTCNIKGRSVIIVEDIVDTGYTIEFLKRYLTELGAAEVKVCTMFFKKDSFKFAGSIDIDYVGQEIDNKFIVGFGLDYDELGRNHGEVFIIDK